MDYEKAHRDLQDLLATQGSHGNWNYSPYMKGLYNGLELALCTLEDRPPVYREDPERWLMDIPMPVGMLPVSEDEFPHA